MYADHPEKRRKRSSLFFRKKKDKSKTKGQSTNCDGNYNFIKVYLLSPTKNYRGNWYLKKMSSNFSWFNINNK